MNKEPFEYNVIEGADTKEKAIQNCVKARLFELKDKKCQLKLPDDDDEELDERTLREEISNSKSNSVSDELHVKWLVVNGNVKLDANETCNSYFCFIFYKNI